MGCREIEEMLSAYAAGELPSDRCEIVESHLDGCAGCREKLEDFRLVRQKLETLREVPQAPQLKEPIMSVIRSGNIPKKADRNWSRRALVLAPVAIILAAILIIQPWGFFYNGMQNTMARVQAAMTEIQSYRVSLVVSSDADDRTIVGKATAEYSAPDRYHYQQTGDDNLEFILIGDRQYIKGPYLSPLALTAMSQTFSNMLSREATLRNIEMLTAIRELPEERIEGTRCFHYRGVYDWEKMIRSQKKDGPKAGLPPISEEEIAEQVQEARSGAGPTTFEVWVGKEDYLIRQMKIVSQDNGSEGETASIVRTLKFYDFNQPVTIEAPVDSGGRLLPGWTSPNPEQPSLKKDFQAVVDNGDPAYRVVKYTVNLTNIGQEALTGLDMSVIQHSDSSLWISHSGLSSPKPNSLEPGESLKYEITFGFDAAGVKPEKAAEEIRNSVIYIEYSTPDSRRMREKLQITEIPDSIYSQPSGFPSLLNLVPAGEYWLEEGAASAGQCTGGEINGKQYLFVPVNTRGSEIPARHGILVLNKENPAQPSKAAYLESPDNSRYLKNLFLSGTVLYVSAEDLLWIIDVSRPEAPREMACFSGLNPGNLIVCGDYAFVQTYLDYGNQSISAMDVSDPSHPQITGSLPVDSRSSMTLDMAGGYLLAWTSSTLQTIDISTPSELKIVNSYTFSLPSDAEGALPGSRISPAYNVGQAIQGNYAFAALGRDGRSGISIMDISDPVNPGEIALLELKGQRIQGPLFAANDRLYTFTQSEHGIDRKMRLAVIDISDPANPVHSGYGILPEYWSLFDRTYNSYSQTYSLVDRYFYWSIGNPPNQPVIAIFDLSAM